MRCVSHVDELCFLSFVRSFLLEHSKSFCAFMFGILLKHFRRLDAHALSLFMLTLSLSLSRETTHL